jgi:hypothetical protein
MPTFTNDPLISKTTSDNAVSVLGESDQNEGVRGVSHNAHGGVVGINDWSPASPPGAGGNGGWFESSQGEGVRGWAKTPHHGGVVGVNTAGGIGVFGQSNTNTGVVGESTAGNGGWFESQQTEGVRGVSHNPDHGGVVGICAAANGIGVFGFCDDGTGTLPGTGVFGKSSGGEGVHGESNNSSNLAAIAGFMINPSGTGPGIYGSTAGRGAALVGQCQSSFESNDAVLGICGVGGNAIHGRGGTNAGLFEGTVVITGGSLQVSRVNGIGGEISATSIFASNKQFVIDHPCDPANKYLHHCSVESPEMMNVYNGNITTNQDGEATVNLPDYFEALNGDCRYQLTVIGQFAQAIVAAEIKNNRFVIKTDRPRVKVSWQVSGVRQDAYAKSHPMVVEREKPAAEKGFFLHPQAHGQPEDKGLAGRRKLKDAA